MMLHRLAGMTVLILTMALPLWAATAVGGPSPLPPQQPPTEPTATAVAVPHFAELPACRVFADARSVCCVAGFDGLGDMPVTVTVTAEYRCYNEQGVGADGVATGTSKAITPTTGMHTLENLCTVAPTPQQCQGYLRFIPVAWLTVYGGADDTAPVLFQEDVFAFEVP